MWNGLNPLILWKDPTFTDRVNNTDILVYQTLGNGYKFVLCYSRISDNHGVNNSMSDESRWFFLMR